MAKTQQDKFANQAVIYCIESAANTLTFKKLETGISLFEKMAWLISRVEYFITGMTATAFGATDDQLDVALTTTDQLVALSLENNAILDMFSIHRVDLGAAATGGFHVRPITKDFSTLPGGGLICPPNPLYLGIKGTALTGANGCRAKIFYTTYELTPDEYWELVEARRMITS